jgi:hypothetical protein
MLYFDVTFTFLSDHTFVVEYNTKVYHAKTVVFKYIIQYLQGLFNSFPNPGYPLLFLYAQHPNGYKQQRFVLETERHTRNTVYYLFLTCMFI